MYISLFKVVIPINYTIKFRELFKDTTKRRNLFYDYLRVSLSVFSLVANKNYSSEYIKQYFVQH